jgi:hypothetical protein
MICIHLAWGLSSRHLRSIVGSRQARDTLSWGSRWRTIWAIISGGFSAITALKDTLKLVHGEEKIEFEAAEDTLQEFVYLFQVFSHENGLHKVYRKEIIELQITTSALVEELNKPWNQERLENSWKEKTNDENFQESDQFEANQCVPSKIPKVGAKVSSNQIESERKTEKRSSELTPEKKQVKFAKISPRSDLLEPFKCTHCPRQYTWLKALSRHMKEAHNETVPPHLKEKKDKITCRICSSLITRDLVTRHLKNVHGVVKVASRAIFRGFVTFNESTWLPLWLENGEPDPPSEMMVPIKDGKVALYGMQYEVEEEKGKEDLSKAEVAPINISALGNNKENARKTGKEDTDIVIDEEVENISVDQSTKERRTFQDDDVLEDMEKALEDLNYPVSPTIDKETSLIQVNRNSSVARCLDPFELQDEFHSDDVKNDSTKTEEDDAEKVFDKDGTKKNGEKDVNKSAAKHGALIDLYGQDAVKNIMDDNDGTMMTEDEDVDESVAKAGGCFTSRQLPKLKVEVFLVQINNGEFWSSSEAGWEVDSDFEDCDNKDFTEGRIEMKKIRNIV